MAFTIGFQWQRWQNLMAIAAFIVLAFMVLYQFRDDASILHVKHPAPPLPFPEAPVPGSEKVPLLEPGHAIDDLIAEASMVFRAVLATETYTLHDAAAAYRRRRNRHPPPGFDQWYKYAVDNDVVMIEELWDQIYHDLSPHWGLPAQYLRDSVAGQEFIISIRDGKLDKKRDKRYRINFWHEMFEKIAAYLPDVDLAFNTMDESRLLVPWVKIENTMTIGQARARISHDLEVISVDDMLASGFSPISTFSNKFTPRPPLVPQNSFNYSWVTEGDYWTLYREVCLPMMPVHYDEPIKDLQPPSLFDSNWPFGSLGGYVRNFSFSQDPCMHHELRGLHGTFIEATSMSTSQNLFPIFGGSRIYGGNDILLPAPRYWTTESKFTGKSLWSFFGTTGDWDKKRNEVMWRGTASGGRHRANTWTHFHRQRFVSMLNGSHLQDIWDNKSVIQNFPRPHEKNFIDIAAIANDELPQWVERVSDAAFTDMQCFPSTGEKTCEYLDPYYEVAEEVDMYKMYDYRFLPDIDGNSFSGRYRAFLLSSSLPIKATIYSEWHDSRLFAWQHFVPMDNTYVDLYGIMDYFMGYANEDGVPMKRGHDRWAKQIATEGQKWARKVLRKEDMLVYIYRLVLEYARITDDNRETMGFVEDLTV